MGSILNNEVDAVGDGRLSSKAPYISDSVKYCASELRLLWLYVTLGIVKVEFSTSQKIAQPGK